MNADTSPEEFKKTAQLDTYAKLVTSKPCVDALSVVNEQPAVVTRRELIDAMAGDAPKSG